MKEKTIEFFKTLSTLERIKFINKLTKELISLRNKIEKDLNSTNVTFASKSFSNGRRNASANSKRGNMNKIYLMYQDNMDLLKELTKYI